MKSVPQQSSKVIKTKKNQVNQEKKALAVPPSLRIPEEHLSQTQKIQERQKLLKKAENQYQDLFRYSFDAEIVGAKNCENLIGSIEIPVGVAGPVLVQYEEEISSQEHIKSVKQSAQNLTIEYLYLPLATSEGALVASTSRGAKCISLSGGSRVQFHRVGMSRSPVFLCKSGSEAHKFVAWLTSQESRLKKLTESTSSHLTYISQLSWIRGRHVYTRFVFNTSQAMGMNMVTIALQHALDVLLPEYTDSQVSLVSLSSNVCTDKKDSAINTILGRGWWAQAEVFIPTSVLKACLQISPEALVQAHVAKNLVGSNVAGSRSQNMQAANVIAAFFAATGQDIAHVVEAAQAFTTVELDENGVYMAVTLPNINCGVVGGGTSLPAQTQARDVIRQGKKSSTYHLVVALTAGVLSAELSGLAALRTSTLAKAHATLGRQK